MSKTRTVHSRRGFIEIILLLLIVVLLLALIGGNSQRSTSSSSSSAPTPASIKADRNATRQALENRLEAVKKRRVEVGAMTDEAVKKRMLLALNEEAANLERILREEF